MSIVQDLRRFDLAGHVVETHTDAAGAVSLRIANVETNSVATFVAVPPAVAELIAVEMMLQAKAGRQIEKKIIADTQAIYRKAHS